MSGPLAIFAVDTIMVFASLVLIAGNLTRLPRNRNAWLVSAILLGGICTVVLGRYQYGFWIPEPYRIDVGAIEPLLNIGRNLSPALFMLLCHSLFQEPKPFPRALYWLIALQVLLEEPVHLFVGNDTPTERLLTEAAPGLLQAVFASLALYWTAAGWSTDLVEVRRRMRIVVLVIVAVLMIGSVLLLRVIIDWDSIENYQANVLLGGLYTLMVAVILVSLLSRHAMAMYLDPGRPAVASTLEPEPEDGDTGADVARLEALMAAGAYRQAGLSLGSLAEQMRLPEYRLRRVIHESLGYRNFNSFLHHYRIDEACRLLRDPDERRTPILTIALSVGYQSINTFNRGFREVMDLTPSAYRAGSEAVTGEVGNRDRPGTRRRPD